VSLKTCHSLLIVAAMLLAACGDAALEATSGPEVAAAAQERPKYPLGLGCGWQSVSDIDTTNVAFPDESATYWVAQFLNVPGTRIRIDGRYPDARYFSYNAYDPAIRPVDAIADFEVVPALPGTNPFLTPGAAPGASYTAYLEFTAKPEQPAPNTMYSGAVALPGVAAPNPLLTPLIYRIYVPADATQPAGVYGLPVLTVETADGAQELLPFADCDVPLLPSLGGTLPPPGLNEALIATDFPEALGLLRFPTAPYPPKSRVFYGLPDTLLAIINNAIYPATLPEALRGTEIGSGGGFLSNKHNAYTSSGFSRNYGNIALLRAKAPRFDGDPRLAPGAEDVRYWSICQNEFVSQRFVACSADYQTVLDDEGYFTVVISDTADRPANATLDNGISWLPWGPFPDGLLIYRQMLPAPHFVQAIANVPYGEDAQALMGEYYPVPAYCKRATFESAGTEPAQIFAACLEETLAREPALLPIDPGVL